MELRMGLKLRKRNVKNQSNEEQREGPLRERWEEVAILKFWRSMNWDDVSLCPPIWNPQSLQLN